MSRKNLFVVGAAGLCLLLSATQASAQDKRLVFGLGSGYSRSVIDEALKHRTWVSQNGDFFYDEEGTLNFSLTAYARYFFTSGIAAQLEFHRQNAEYYGYLKNWTVEYLAPGASASDPDAEMIRKTIREDPHRDDFSVNSLTLSVLLAFRRVSKRTDYPFFSVGIGYYFLGADRERVLERFPLGPDTTGFLTKVAGGYKYSFSPSFGVSLRLLGEFHSIRSMGGTMIYAEESLFHETAFLHTDRIVRKIESTPATFSYFSLDISFEFSLF